MTWAPVELERARLFLITRTSGPSAPKKDWDVSTNSTPLPCRNHGRLWRA
jgi:hypothetical protein